MIMLNWNCMNNDKFRISLITLKLNCIKIFELGIVWKFLIGNCIIILKLELNEKIGFRMI